MLFEGKAVEERKIDPRHSGVRAFLRVVGPLTAMAGLVFAIVGFASFFSAFGSFGPPRYFWCAFVGLPLMVVGIGMTAFGFMGAVVRYQAGELAPVGKDAFNYLAKGTKDGVKAVAGAIGAGLAEGTGARGTQEKTVLRCHKCNADNDADAKFCSQCGAALSKTRPCPDCADLTDPDAKFCDNCGRELA